MPSKELGMNDRTYEANMRAMEENAVGIPTSHNEKEVPHLLSVLQKETQVLLECSLALIEDLNPVVTLEEARLEKDEDISIALTVLGGTLLGQIETIRVVAKLLASARDRLQV